MKRLPWYLDPSRQSAPPTEYDDKQRQDYLEARAEYLERDAESHRELEDYPGEDQFND